jgi:hypothetical protein
MGHGGLSRTIKIGNICLLTSVLCHLAFGCEVGTQGSPPPMDTEAAALIEKKL